MQYKQKWRQRWGNCPSASTCCNLPQSSSRSSNNKSRGNCNEWHGNLQPSALQGIYNNQRTLKIGGLDGSEELALARPNNSQQQQKHQHLRGQFDKLLLSTFEQACSFITFVFDKQFWACLRIWKKGEILGVIVKFPEFSYKIFSQLILKK